MAAGISIPTNGVYRFNLAEHHEETCSAFYSMMESGQYSDVTLTAGGRKFKCHKMMLSASCPYFKVMFSLPFEENQNNDVDIKDIKSDTMKSLIEYIYKGGIDITIENVQDIIFAADMFQLDALKHACSLFLQRQLKTYNCLGMWNIARQLQMEELEEKAWSCVMSYFPRVAEQEEFSALDVTDLCQMLSDPKVKISSEEVVCKSALRWMSHSSDRKIYLETVMKSIHLTELNPAFIRTGLMNHSLFKGSSHWKDLFQQVLDHLTMNMPCPNDFSNLPLRVNTDTTAGVLLLGGKVSRPMSRTHDCTFVTIDSSVDINDKTQSVVKQEVITQLPAVHKYTASCSQGNTVFVSGMGSNLKGFWKFDGSHQWARCKAMRTSRNGHTLLSGFTNALFVVGGTEVSSDVAHNISCIEEYNITENSWRVAGSLSLPVCYAGAMFYSGKIFVMGGFMTNRSACSKIQMFDTQTGVCVKLETRLPRTMAYCKGLVVQENLLLVDKEMTLVFKGNDLLGSVDEEESQQDNSLEAEGDETSEGEQEAEESALDLSGAEHHEDSYPVWNLSPTDDATQEHGHEENYFDGCDHDGTLIATTSNLPSACSSGYWIKPGCGVELAAAECLGDKLIVFGGRKDIRDLASNRILSRSIRVADVDDFLTGREIQPVWKLVGRLQYPMIVFMTAKIKIKK